MYKAHLTVYTLVLAAFLTVAILTSYRPGDPSAGRVDALPQVIEPVSLNKAFDFAGEPLPMDNFDVRERLDRELTVNSYWHSSTVLQIKRAARYFPVIEPILADQGVPDDLKFLAVAESGLEHAVSPAGARGIWQFMERTGKSYDLEINDEVDERYHIEKSTLAFCIHIKKLKERFGSWTLAAAAYNMGEAGLAKEMERQSMTSYYDLNLSDETMRYVFRVVAAKEIVTEPRKFGFYLEPEEGYNPLHRDYMEIEVDTPIHRLGEFALAQGTTYRMLKIYNPWLRTSSLSNPNGKTYTIKLPAAHSPAPSQGSSPQDSSATRSGD